jgi:hypothetical protein
MIYPNMVTFGPHGFYGSYFNSLSNKAINSFCRKCPDNGECELTNGSMITDGIGKFLDREYLQENF